MAAIGLGLAADVRVMAQSLHPAKSPDAAWAQREADVAQLARAELTAEKKLTREALLKHWQDLLDELDDERIAQEKKAAIRMALAQTMTPADWREMADRDVRIGAGTVEIAYQLVKAGDMRMPQKIEKDFDRYGSLYSDTERPSIVWALSRFGRKDLYDSDREPLKHATAMDFLLLAEHPDPIRKYELLEGLRFTDYGDEVRMALLRIGSPVSEWVAYWTARWHNPSPPQDPWRLEAEKNVATRTLGSLRVPAVLPTLQEAMRLRTKDDDYKSLHEAALEGLELYTAVRRQEMWLRKACVIRLSIPAEQRGY